MLIFRFMSMKEFEDFQNGKVLFNDKDHHNSGCKTKSVGFCFMDCENETPESAYEYLAGIVSDDVCAVFKVDDYSFIESVGTYANPNSFNFYDTIEKEELCCQSYCKARFKLMKYAFNVDYDKFKWISCE